MLFPKNISETVEQNMMGWAVSNHREYNNYKRVSWSWRNFFEKDHNTTFWKIIAHSLLTTFARPKLPDPDFRVGNHAHYWRQLASTDTRLSQIIPHPPEDILFMGELEAYSRQKVSLHHEKNSSR